MTYTIERATISDTEGELSVERATNLKGECLWIKQRIKDTLIPVRHIVVSQSGAASLKALLAAMADEAVKELVGDTLGYLMLMNEVECECDPEVGISNCSACEAGELIDQWHMIGDDWT